MPSPETSFNALGGLMQLFQETVQEYQREITRLNATIIEMAKKLAVVDSQGALQERSPTSVHVRSGVKGGRPGGDGLPLGEAHEEQEPPEVQAREEHVAGAEEVGCGPEERLGVGLGEQRLVDPFGFTR